MRFEFDADADAIYRDKHGVSLAFGERVWSDAAHVVVPTIRVEDDERRFRAIGTIEVRLWTAVHVYRGDGTEDFCQKANDGEKRAYDRAQG